MQKIKNILNEYLKPADKVLLTLLLSVLLLTFGYYLANAMGAQFVGASFISFKTYELLPIMLVLFGVSLYARDVTPRIGLVTWSYSMFYLIVTICNSMVYFVQLTPFPTIDFSLVHLDQLLGFNQLAWLNWTHAHPFIARFVNQCYGLMSMQMAVVPFILALLLQKRALRVLFMSLILSFIVGTAIYYFMPTTAPASMFYDPNFALQQHDTFIKFYEIHHHLPVTTMAGGLIAFPSFHVVWACLLAYSFRHKKLWFYPMALFNVIIILSTLMLGWHYLTDVIGGVTLAGLSILASEYMHQRYMAFERKKKAIDTATTSTAFNAAPALIRDRNIPIWIP